MVTEMLKPKVALEGICTVIWSVSGRTASATAPLRLVLRVLSPPLLAVMLENPPGSELFEKVVLPLLSAALPRSPEIESMNVTTPAAAAAPFIDATVAVKVAT